MDEATKTPQQEFPPEVTKLLKLFVDKLARENTVGEYANNTRFESSVWDLKLFFGQLQQEGSVDVNWRTSVTIPWMQAKILDYYLRLNIAYHERLYGQITVPESIKPKLASPTQEQLKDDPNAQDLFEEYQKIHSDIFHSDIFGS